MTGRAWWWLCPDGVVHLPAVQGSRLLTTSCGRSGGTPSARAGAGRRPTLSGVFAAVLAPTPARTR